MGPLISVIVPIYNVASYLDRCISSLIAQSYQNLEIILVNDGSTDESEAVCEKYAQSDSRVRLIVQKNGGPASARNMGMECATGAYFSFIDGDDWVAPNLYQRMVEVIQAFQPDMIRFGYRKMLHGRVAKVYRLPYSEGLYQGKALEQIQMDTVCNERALDYDRTRILSACGNLYRRDLILQSEISFVSEREILNEDYLFVLQASLASRSIYICQDLFYYYDTRPNSITTVYRTEMYQRKRALYERYQAVLARQDERYQARLNHFYIDCIYACIVNECTSRKPAYEAIQSIRFMLNDKELRKCLDTDKLRSASQKAKVICWMMRCRMAGCIYWGYRLVKQFRGAKSSL